MARFSILAISAAAALLAGCGSSGDGEAATQASSEEATQSGGGYRRSSDAQETAMVAKRKARRRGKRVKAVSSTYGPVVADRRGEAFYLFDKEKGKASRCYGECARAWPPVITRGRPRAGKGVKARLLGTTKRRNGKLQATYAGHPLYYYVDDEPGRILCQNVDEFGGLWLVVKPNGRPVS